MALGLNPVGDVLKKADRVLVNAGETLGTVDTRLANVDATLGKVDKRMTTVDQTLEETKALLTQVQGLLAELIGGDRAGQGDPRAEVEARRGAQGGHQEMSRQ